MSRRESLVGQPGVANNEENDDVMVTAVCRRDSLSESHDNKHYSAAGAN
jgi:hypothetical protein